MKKIFGYKELMELLLPVDFDISQWSELIQEKSLELFIYNFLRFVESSEDSEAFSFLSSIPERFVVANPLLREGLSRSLGLMAVEGLAPDKFMLSVESLGLSDRTLNCLRRRGIDSVNEIYSFGSKEDFLKIRNFGEKSYQELNETLCSTGLPVLNEVPPIFHQLAPGKFSFEDFNKTKRYLINHPASKFTGLGQSGLDATIFLIQRFFTEDLGSDARKPLEEILHELKVPRDSNDTFLIEFLTPVLEAIAEAMSECSDMTLEEKIALLGLDLQDLLHRRLPISEEKNLLLSLDLSLSTHSWMLAFSETFFENNYTKSIGEIIFGSVTSEEMITSMSENDFPLHSIERAFQECFVELSLNNNQNHTNLEQRTTANSLLDGYAVLFREFTSLRLAGGGYIKNGSLENIVLEEPNGYLMNSEEGNFITFTQTERDENILVMRLGMGMTLEQVGSKLSVTRERVRQLQSKIIQRINNKARSGYLTELIFIKWFINKCLENHGGHLNAQELARTLGCSRSNLLLYVGVIEHLQNSDMTPVRYGLQKMEGWYFSKKEELFSTKDYDSYVGEIEGHLVNLKFLPVDTLSDLMLGDFPGFSPGLLLEEMYEKRYITVLDCDPVQEMQSGRWVVSRSSTTPVREITRAILYGSAEQYSFEQVKLKDHLKYGLRSDQIANWLEHNSEYKPTVRALSALCERQSKIFVKTGSDSWGFIGAGAKAHVDSKPSIQGAIDYAIRELSKEERFITKKQVYIRLEGYFSSQWVNQHIDRMLEDGYIENISTSNILKERYNLRPGSPLPTDLIFEGTLPVLENKVTGPATSDILIDVLSQAEFPLSSNEIVSRVRMIDESASVITLYVYINNLMDDVIEKLSDGKYRLITTGKKDPARSSQEISTIGAVVTVLYDSPVPLTAEEIYLECLHITQVRKNAVVSYLAQNYKGLFGKTSENLYYLVKE